MARTKKSEEVVEKVEETKKVSTTKKEKEEDNNMKEILAQMAEMQKQIKEMQKQNEKLSQEKNLAEQLVETLKSNKNDDKDFSLDEEITVISQTDGALILSTEGYGRGIIYRFEKFGEIKDIPFEDLRNICKNMSKFAQQGMFYITNEKAVEKLRLKQYYNRMISSEDMCHLFDKDAKTAIELYKLSSDLQKEQIISLVKDRVEKGIEVDNNILVELGKLSGKKLLDI